MLESDRGWRVWRRLYWRICKVKLSPVSVHRKDLSLTTRHQCYAADERGYRKSGSQCSDLSHYWPSTLMHEGMRRGLVVTPSRPQDWSKGVWDELRQRQTDLAADRTRRETQLLRHERVCEDLATRPWLATDVAELLSADDDAEWGRMRNGRTLVVKRARSEVKQGWRRFLSRRREEKLFIVNVGVAAELAAEAAAHELLEGGSADAATVTEGH